jgi:trk system potassium uptake protein
MLRRLQDLPLLVLLMGVSALLMYLPALHAFGLRDHTIARTFFYGGTVFLALTFMIALATANRPKRDAGHAYLAILVGAYLALPVILAVPLHQALQDTSFLNAWFEMVSSLTTTGASVYEPSSRLSPSLHLWRGLVGWMGGLFILVAAVAILAPLNLGGAEVMTGRAPGVGRNDLRIADPAERFRRQFLAIFPVYAALTIILWALLTAAGDSGFVALCHAMATLSSSGISPVGGLTGATSGRLGEALIFVFLIFALSRRLWPGSAIATDAVPLRTDPELRLAILVVAAVTAVLIFRHLVWVLDPDQTQGLGDVLRDAWGAAFTTLSFLTTNGLISNDWVEAGLWSGLGAPGLLLAGLAMMGGGIATTAGGIKLLRVYALARHGERQLERQIHPSSVGGSGTAARRLRRDGANLAWTFFVLFGLSIGFICAILTLTGQPFEPALLFSIASMTNTGPLPLASGGQGFSYADLDSLAKIVCAVGMVIGRVETLAILALLTTDRWQE